MPKFVKQSTEEFPKDPMDKKLLLASIKKYSPDGLRLGVEKVSKPYRTSFGKVQLTVQLTVMDEVKCLMYDLDENAQYIIEEDEFGEEKKKMSVKDGYLATAILFMNVNCDSSEIDETTEFTVYPTSGTYPLFKAGFVANGDLPENNDDEAIVCTGQEVKEALEGFDFIGKYAKSKTKFKFDYLDVIVDEE